MKTLDISKDLKLPVNSTTQKFGWLGVTGSGKTYGASKYAEELWGKSVQFIVLDPVGVWYGLRLAEDGKKPSHINIPIFGGLHGDVPLEPTGGELIANLIVDKGLSCIIDVSQFEHDTDKARFAKDFANRLFFRKKSAPSAIHLFLEECQEFVPQNPQRGEEQMLHAFIRMQKLGRNFGIGSSYISQRPQEVNKKALNMCQTLFVFRTTGTHERTAIEKWIEDKSLDESIANDLPKIPTGSCHVWSPEFLKISEIIRISLKQTFNASATPEVGAVAKARHLAPIELDKIRTEMAATIEKAKSEDPKLLKNEIFELENEIKKNGIKKETLVCDPSLISKEVTKALMENKRQWQKEKEAMEKYIAQLLRALTEMCTQGGRALEIKRIVVERSPGYIEPKAIYNASLVSPSQEKRQHAPVPLEKTQFDSEVAHNDGPKPLSKCAQTILLYLQTRTSGQNRKTKSQLWIATGYTPSGSFNNAIYELTGQNLIEKDAHGFISNSQNNQEFDTSIEKWFSKVSACAKKILQLMLQDPYTAITKDDLILKTGYQPSGSFNNAIYELTGPELIIKKDGGYIINPEVLEL